ncbi:MAG: hypothetical protein NTZ07_02990 [Candidatus Woesebacteria bacterium]|nr:hypothetical protein [Candidatus Woesebacteria bacterium]
MKLNIPTFVISKRADSLAEALKKSPQSITIWVRSGKFKNKFPLIRSAITYEAVSDGDAKEYVKRFVSVFPIPKTHIKLSVLKGISSDRVSQLLAYTKRDKLIRTQTHDFDYFKSKKTFVSWKSRGKIIYTLINRNGKLLGTAWFNKKRQDNYKVVPIIRIYPPARGKKVVRKFLEIIRSEESSKPNFPNYA